MAGATLISSEEVISSDHEFIELSVKFLCQGRAHNKLVLYCNNICCIIGQCSVFDHFCPSLVMWLQILCQVYSSYIQNCIRATFISCTLSLSHTHIHTYTHTHTHTRTHTHTHTHTHTNVHHHTHPPHTLRYIEEH